jgi:hypothetical protein
MLIHSLFLIVLDSFLFQDLKLKFVHLDFINEFGLGFLQFEDLLLAVKLSLVGDFHVVHDLLNLNFVDVDAFFGLGKFLLVFGFVLCNCFFLLLH